MVDRREKLPLWEGCKTATLLTGDYTVDGYHGSIAVERKSLADLFGSLGGKGGVRRKRLLREFARLSLMRYGAVVIEGGYPDLFSFPHRGRISAPAVIGSILSWSAAYRVPVWMAGTRVGARNLIKTYLRLAFEAMEQGGEHRHLRPICACGGGGFLEHAVRCPAGVASE